MKKIFLLIISFAVVLCSVFPAFASEPTKDISNEILGTWVFVEDLSKIPISASRKFTFNFTVTSTGTQYNGFWFFISEARDSRYYQGNDGIYVYGSSVGWVDPDYRTIHIDTIPSDPAEASALLDFLNLTAEKKIVNDFVENVSSSLSPYLSWVGVILSSLFIPSGSLYQLGLVIIVGLVIFVFYLAYKAFRQLTPGV